MKEYLQQHLAKRDIEQKDLPNLIVVNSKYNISNVGPEGYSERNKTRQEWGILQVRADTPYIGGVSPMHMLTRIQKFCAISSRLVLDHDG